MVSRVVQVVNPTGIHLRPAGVLCQASKKFKSKILILHSNKVLDAKSVLNLMTCGIKCGEEIEIQCTGEDEVEALESICEVIKNGLEDY